MFYQPVETGWYYLNSRYYNPEIGRFINADGLIGLQGVVLGHNMCAYTLNNPVMGIDPNGEFVIAIGTLLTAALVGAAIGGSIGFVATVYKDYKDDGHIFNGSIGADTYLGYTLGGAVAGALGAAAGTAALVGSSATLFTAGGTSITFGSALAMGTGISFATGMAGYSIRACFNSKEDYNFGTMLSEGTFNALNGALTVSGGYLVGITGFRIDYASKLLSRKTDLLIRPIIQNLLYNWNKDRVRIYEKWINIWIKERIMMKKNTYTSLLKTFSLLMTSFLEIIFGISLLLCFLLDSPRKLKIGFSIIIIISLIFFQYILLFLIDRLFSYYGKNKIIITKDHIKTKKEDIFISESTKVLYSPINFWNIVYQCPGELVVIKNGNKIMLGWFTKREIKKMMEFLPNIKFV